MKIHFQTLSHDPLQWNAGRPEKFMGVPLPGATVLSATGDFGSLCIQQIKEKNYSIDYNVLNILQHFTLQCKTVSKGLFTRLVLQNHIRHDIKGVGEMYIREGQFSMLKTSYQEIITGFEEKNQYMSFDTFFSPGLLDELLPLFPKVQAQFNSAESMLLIQPPRRAGREIRELVQSILKCSYEEKLRSYFFESKVKELLFQFLMQLSETRPQKYIASETEINAVYTAEKIITADLAAHQFIPDLSRKVNMNEFHFKLVFKQIFGTGPFEYRQQKRLEKAKELLETGLSVKEVAIQTGYRITNFVNTFRDYFGYTPGSIKRGKR
jgi:AraC-like DNA-binding protein